MFVCSPLCHAYRSPLSVFSLPQVPPHAAGTEQTHPGDSHTQPPQSVTNCTSSMCAHTEGLACSGFWSGHHSCGQSAACPEESVCVNLRYPPMYVDLSWICVFLYTYASCFPRKNFEPSPGNPLGMGLGKLKGMYVQSCQMDLCPSWLWLALRPWQQIRTESCYKGATDIVETELD